MRSLHEERLDRDRRASDDRALDELRERHDTVGLTRDEAARWNAIVNRRNAESR